MTAAGGLTSKDIVVVALLSATYVAYGLLSSYTVGIVTHGTDTHFVRSATVVVLAAYIRKFTGPTLMGVVSGLLFGFLIPAAGNPAGLLYLPPSVFAYAFLYDVYMRQAGYPGSPTRGRHVIIGTIIGSIAMSVIALTVLTLVQVFTPEVILFAWVGELIGGIALGIGGSLLGIRIVRQLRLANT